MKHSLPPEKELELINTSLQKGERNTLWLTAAAMLLLLMFIVAFNNDTKKPIKKESPKQQLQAGLHAY